ncbi:hypothetical protein [Anatilimnocola floriformis]|uniref:hypothetical protein n=1 Tax=Anatilimnocola floriformis TaxID=2948575 RepID=UPI0020C32141|nr:hypothetical protein [Anatilimnocola floriformis]
MSSSEQPVADKPITVWEVAQTLTGFLLLLAIGYSWLFTLTFINRCNIRWNKQNYGLETFVVTAVDYDANGEFGPDYHLDGEVAGSSERHVPRLRRDQAVRGKGDLARLFPAGTKLAVYYNPTMPRSIIQNESLRVLTAEPDFWQKEINLTVWLGWRVFLPVPVMATIYLLVRRENFRRSQLIAAGSDVAKRGRQAVD